MLQLSSGATHFKVHISRLNVLYFHTQIWWTQPLHTSEVFRNFFKGWQPYKTTLAISLTHPSFNMPPWPLLSARTTKWELFLSHKSHLTRRAHVAQIIEVTSKKITTHTMNFFSSSHMSGCGGTKYHLSLQGLSKCTFVLVSRVSLEQE